MALGGQLLFIYKSLPGRGLIMKPMLRNANARQKLWALTLDASSQEHQKTKDYA